MTTTSVRPAAQSSADWIAIEQATFMPNRRPPMVIERGQGSRVWDVEGREYLDMIAGIAVISIGHSSPVIQRGSLRAEKQRGVCPLGSVVRHLEILAFIGSHVCRSSDDCSAPELCQGSRAATAFSGAVDCSH